MENRDEIRRLLAAHMEFAAHMAGHVIAHLEDLAAEMEMEVGTDAPPTVAPRLVAPAVAAGQEF